MSSICLNNQNNITIFMLKQWGLIEERTVRFNFNTDTTVDVKVLWNGTFNP